MLWYPYDARTVMGSKSPLHNPVCCRWDRVGTHLRRFLSMRRQWQALPLLVWTGRWLGCLHQEEQLKSK